MTIAKIQRVPLREVWKHEAVDFTRWLEENFDVLNEFLDIPLVGADREQSAGTFNVDLVAEDRDGNSVVIENQLEKSDHQHLGKVITYLTRMEARAAIWIVAHARPEHVGAITWLNETSNAAFYLFKIEAVRIEGSAPAPLLTLIVGPSAEGKEIGKKKKDLAGRYIIRQRFWTELLDRAKEKTKLHVAVSPSRDNWLGTGAGKSGLSFVYVIRQHEARVELYIDRGKATEEENKVIFEQLMAHRAKIEETFGGPLIWQRLDATRACRIKKDIEQGGYRDEAKWPEIHEAMIDAMLHLSRAFKPHIARLQV